MSNSNSYKNRDGSYQFTSNGSSEYSSSDYDQWGSFSSYQMDPAFVFLFEGIEFWGTSRASLHDIVDDDSIKDLCKEDLIINCSGTEFVSQSFVKKSPDWVDLPESGEIVPRAQQILFDWMDMSPPPISIDIKFWEDIIVQAKKNGITRIFCCCGAGIGRTGTALSAFLLASGLIDEPDVAINFVRERYTNKAVETQGQEIYLFNLIYNIEDLFEYSNKIATKELPSEPSGL
jgi:protein-tyrosine phosphatase